MYDKLDVIDNDEHVAVDAAGYTGNFRRTVLKNQSDMSEQDFIEVFKTENRLADLMRII